MNKNYDLRLKGFVGDWNFDDEYVDYILDKFSDRTVDVLIDSTGGDVATALSISAAFRNHGDVNVHFVGMNASAATIASLGAKRITIDAQALYLVHRCSASVIEFANMNAEEIDAKCRELEKKKANLEKLDMSVAASYAKRCKKSPDALLELMQKDTWLTANEALEWGFVDEVTDFVEDSAPVLDSLTALAFSQNGIPVPDAMQPKKNSSFAQKIIAFFKNFSVEENNIDNNTNLNSTNMDPVTNNSTEQQPEVISTPEENNASAESNINEAQAISTEEIVDDRDAQIKALKDEIESLKNQAAPQHHAVVETPATKPDKFDYFENMKAAAELYNSLP